MDRIPQPETPASRPRRSVLKRAAVTGAALPVVRPARAALSGIGLIAKDLPDEWPIDIGGQP